MFRSAFESSKDSLDFIFRMAYIAEIKEWDNRSHLERIRRYCYLIASELEMTQQDIETISTAGMLHDIGKVQTPENLLSKQGEFTKAEWEVMEAHAVNGANILAGASSPILQAAEIIAYTHHERWDGSGYPRGLRGEEIPMTGRIVALADVYDALTTARPYKEAIDTREGLKIIQDSSGILFDPRLVDIFTKKFNDILRMK